MNALPCGCCAGVEAATPGTINNRPGLDALAYRVGTYNTFFETMKAALSSKDYPALGALRTREADDPTIALLDAFAMVADVLTFYQERIANEGYLRTATERQSVLYLVRLLGSQPRPGVSASVYLAYTVDPSTVAAATIPAGTRVQSQPSVQGALPQPFEIEGDLSARGAWNNIKPRLTEPQVISGTTAQFYVNGTNVNLKANDPIAIVASDQVLARVQSVEQQFAEKRTLVVLQPVVKTASAGSSTDPATPAPLAPLPTSQPSLIAAAVDLVKSLTVPPAGHPANSLSLQRSASQSFAPQADMTPALLSALHPLLHAQLYTGLKNTTVPEAAAKVFALRVQASPFGSTAPRKNTIGANGAIVGTEEWPLAGSTSIQMVLSVGRARAEEPRFALLDSTEEVRVYISISDGDKSATRSFSLPQKAGDDKIGAWTVKMKIADESFEAAFSPSLPRFVLKADRKARGIMLTAGDGDPLEVMIGETASTTGDGTETSLSMVDNIAIRYLVADEADGTVLALDGLYDQILPGSLLTIQRPDWTSPRFTTVNTTQKVTVSRYNQTVKVTQLTLSKPWLDEKTDRMLSAVRSARISTQSEALDLAPRPIAEEVSGAFMELGDVYSDLTSGRWMIVQGERTDAPAKGIMGTELVMLAGVDHGVRQIAAAPAADASASAGPSSTTAPDAMQPLPGDTTHTTISFAQPLSYKYKRDSVSVFGNVVRATHGESRSEVLGSGDGTQAMQQFKLRYPNLTYVPGSAAGGVNSTLQVRVNDIAWEGVATLASAGPMDRVYTTRTNALGITAIQFGDGTHGMRLPTGVANVRATYRSGTGTSGNADGGKINMLAMRPLGVKSVVNPLPSTAGADSDSTQQTRHNTSLSVGSLDRLVSIGDYSAYALTFAAIGKAAAVKLSDGRSQIVYVTVAGTEGTVLNEHAEPFMNLAASFQQLGDPNLMLRIGVAQFALLVIGASVQLQDGYLWTDVAPLIRAALLTAFAFDQRRLGQPAFLSVVMSSVQQVEGVLFVNVTTFDSISEADTQDAASLTAKLEQIVSQPAAQSLFFRDARLGVDGELLPAQIAYLNPDLPDTLILTEAL